MKYNKGHARPGWTKDTRVSITNKSPNRPTIKHYCQFFSVSDVKCAFEGCKNVAVSLHHIIPRRCNGCHELWNLFPICEHHHDLVDGNGDFYDMKKNEWTWGEENMFRQLEFQERYHKDSTLFKYKKSLAALRSFRRRAVRRIHRVEFVSVE